MITTHIDEIIIRQLKRHYTSTEDLTHHVEEKITPKYPDNTITIPGIKARLTLLEDQLQVEQRIINRRAVWKIPGEDNIPNKVWRIITSLEKLQCDIQSITYTIKKQDDSITVSQINNAIGILEAKKIIQVNHTIASLTPIEKKFMEMCN